MKDNKDQENRLRKETKCIFSTKRIASDEECCNITYNFGNTGTPCDGLSDKKRCPLWSKK